MQRHIYIGIPAYDSKVHVATMVSLMDSIAEIKALGFEATLRVRTGDAMIAKARNSLAADFLLSKCTDLVMIDADQGWPPGTLARLLSHDVDVVAGMVPAKCEPESYPMRWLTDRKYLNADPATGLLEVDGIGTGFIRYSRVCIERMVEAQRGRAYPDRWVPDGKAFAIYDTMYEDGLYWGEDLMFCRRWRALGGKVWVDPTLRFSHYGEKCYEGNVGSWLRNRPREEFENGFSATAGLTNCKSVVLAVASRGRLELLQRTLDVTLSHSVLDSTRIVVALDDDEPRLYTDNPKLIISHAPREDSLGAKYNRCHGLHAADLYVVATDDAQIVTPGWDRRLLEATNGFPDGIGVVHFGKMQVASAMPAMYAITRQWIERVGYFQPGCFPTWWHDTWTNEIARMVGRIARAEVEIDYPDAGEAAKSRGIRDIAFWAEFFDRTRPVRKDHAVNLILDSGFRCPDKVWLLGCAAALVAEFEREAAFLRDPAVAARLERDVAFDAPDDDRYRRVKARAEEILRQMDEQLALRQLAA